MLRKSDLMRLFARLLPLLSLIQHGQLSSSPNTMATLTNKDLGTIEAPTTLMDTENWSNSTQNRSKREVYRGQNYHFQRGYELSRLRFENQNKNIFSRPKAFFLREYHLGRDMPNQLLELTQLQKLTAASATARPLIDTGSTGTSDPVDSDRTSDSQGDRMKPMSNDYQKQYWATKNALKAALANNEKDIRITELLDALNKRNRAKPTDDDTSDADSQGENIEQIKDDKERGGSGGDDANKNVHFDEQIKEDLNKINAYDPNKAYGERLRPYQGAGVESLGKNPNNSIDNQLRRLFPQLFAGSGSSGNSSPAAGGSPGRGRYPQAGITGIGGSSYYPSLGGGGNGIRGENKAGGSPGGGLLGGNGRPTGSGVGGIGNSTRYIPGGGPLTGILGSANPSRFPGNRISSLTLYPKLRNSTYPGIPGYVSYDFPAYTSIPYTGFRCDLQAYKQGYFADTNAGCQVFHVCQKDGRMDSFLCPNGTLFHQKVMTCDWWYHVNCPSSPGYYYLNGRIGVLPWLPATLNRFD